jgi:hypothetical protein
MVMISEERQLAKRNEDIEVNLIKVGLNYETWGKEGKTEGTRKRVEVDSTCESRENCGRRVRAGKLGSQDVNYGEGEGNQ